ncbi:uncharacterized protein BXZ73DRAFT_50916, partial [Epithele typhae]|uniref:uncharacterized protein n=1 Tax=Epithele typhae TaxID=378194 RepID=UPI00200825A4
SWSSPYYAFFEKRPRIDDSLPGKRCYVFTCLMKGKGCKTSEKRRYLQTGDSSSTSGLKKHAISCWGQEAVDNLVAAQLPVDDARQKLLKTKPRSGDISVIFERADGAKGPVTYSNRQHTNMEVRCGVTSRWVAESSRPYNIVKDRHLLTLLKTGRPNYQVPSASTVARDVKAVFAGSRATVRKLLWNYPGRLSFSTDCWTAPNGRPYMAVVVYFIHKTKPISMLLDVIEITEVHTIYYWSRGTPSPQLIIVTAARPRQSHTGATLAREFVRILREFGIDEKVSSGSSLND